MKRGICFVFAALLAGCASYRGAKVVDGSDLALGITFPWAEGSAQLELLNWLEGFRLGVAENSSLKVDYRVSETNSFLWGAVETRRAKRIEASVDPCETR